MGGAFKDFLSPLCHLSRRVCGVNWLNEKGQTRAGALREKIMQLLMVYIYTHFFFCKNEEIIVVVVELDYRAASHRFPYYIYFN